MQAFSLNTLQHSKKKFISFFIVFLIAFLAFASCSISALSFNNNSYESIAKKMGHDFYNCEVISENPKENFRSLFNYTDDLAGKEIKNYLDSFVLSSRKKEYTPITISVSDDFVVEINSVLQYTTWQFHKYNYGLKTYYDENHSTRELGPNEIYINDIVADSLVSSGKYVSYDELIGLEVDCLIGSSYKKMKIVDIITNLSKVSIGPYFNECSVITRYVNTANWFSNLTYVYILRGGPLSKTYALTCIEGTIIKLNSENKSYVSHYYRLVSNKLIEDGINDLRVATSTFYLSRQNKKLLYFLILTLSCLFIFSMLVIFDVVHREAMVSLFVAAIIYAFILRFIDPIFIIGGKVIALSNMPGSVIMLFVLIFFFCLFLLLEPSGNKKGNNIETKKRKIL